MAAAVEPGAGQCRAHAGLAAGALLRPGLPEVSWLLACCDSGGCRRAQPGGGQASTKHSRGTRSICAPLALAPPSLELLLPCLQPSFPLPASMPRREQDTAFLIAITLPLVALAGAVAYLLRPLPKDKVEAGRFFEDEATGGWPALFSSLFWCSAFLIWLFAIRVTGAAHCRRCIGGAASWRSLLQHLLNCRVVKPTEALGAATACRRGVRSARGCRAGAGPAGGAGLPGR